MSRISQTLFTMQSAALGSLSILIVLQAASVGGATPASAKTNAAPRLTIQETPINRDLKAATSVAPVVKRVGPSVVNI
jgi:S1-C subfamily serine protease